MNETLEYPEFLKCMIDQGSGVTVWNDFLACENMKEKDALSKDEELAKTENLNIL